MDCHSFGRIHLDLGGKMLISESQLRHLYYYRYLPLLASHERAHYWKDLERVSAETVAGRVQGSAGSCQPAGSYLRVARSRRKPPRKGDEVKRDFFASLNQLLEQTNGNSTLFAFAAGIYKTTSNYAPGFSTPMMYSVCQGPTMTGNPSLEISTDDCCA